MFSQTELETKLQQRLKESIDSKEALQAKVRKMQDSLQRLFSKNNRRSRDTVEDLDKKIADLEHERTVTSLSLAQERDVLRQIKSLEKSKVQVREYKVHEEEVQATKAQLDESRSQIKQMAASIIELEAGLARVKLANKIGCMAAELATDTMECPPGKVGMVIGKGGSTMNRIMKETNVTMDVDKTTNAIKITGSLEGVEKAKREIQKITLSTEIEFIGSKNLVTYLTSKHIKLVQTLRNDHDDLYIDVDRTSRKVSLRGMPGIVETARAIIEGAELENRELMLKRRESVIVVGRKGATITRLTESHMVAIDVQRVDEESSKATIIGPPTNVAEACDEIESLLHDNKEVEETIPLSVMLKRILLSEAAKHLRAIQDKINEELVEADGSVYLKFDKDQRDSNHPELLVKAKQCAVLGAVELTEEGINELKSLIVSRPIVVELIPRIVGKGGENIKKITAGINAYLEVDRDAGVAHVGATTVEERDTALEKLDELIKENQLLKIDADLNAGNQQFRELIRSKTLEEIRKITRLDFDSEKMQFVFRGSNENNEKAKEMLETFLAENHIQEIEATDEDIDVLISGGKDSKITKIADETKADINASRSRSSITIRGTKPVVTAAVESINTFLNGGDGHTVAKITISDQVAGVVIGKGGKKRMALEEQFGGVSINVSRKQRISIRGPEAQVAACRVEILKLISSARVTQSIKVAESQKQALDKNNAIKRIMQTIPVYISYKEESLDVRGNFHDVRDAVSLLKEQVSGVYISSIELEAPQFAKIRNTCRDPSHFERMQDESKAQIKLDLSAGSVVVSGKRSRVRKAKDLLFGFLEFILPKELARVKLPKHLHSSVGKALILTDVSANAGGCMVYLDRDIGSVIVVSADTEKVKTATELMGEKIKKGEKLAFMIQLDKSEAWIIPRIVGKDGAQISAMRKQTNCTITLLKDSNSVVAAGETEEAVATAKEALTTLIDKLRKSNVPITIPEPAMAAFMGKGGSNIKAFKSTHGVDMPRGRKGNNSFRITGKEEKVLAAKQAVDEWVSKWQEANGSTTIKLTKKQVPAIIGTKGETVRSLQTEFGVRIDVNSKTFVVTVEKGASEKREAAIAKIKELAEAVPVAPEPAAVAEETAEKPPQKKKNGNSNGQKTKQEAAAAEEVEPADKTRLRAAEFPTNPIGVASSNGGKKGKKAGATVNSTSLQHGTEAGRNLFEMLISE